MIGIGVARSEQASVGPFNELVEFLRRVRSGTQIDDTLGGALKFMDVFLSAVCKFCGGKLHWWRTV